MQYAKADFAPWTPLSPLDYCTLHPAGTRLSKCGGSKCEAVASPASISQSRACVQHQWYSSCPAADSPAVGVCVCVQASKVKRISAAPCSKKFASSTCQICVVGVPLHSPTPPLPQASFPGQAGVVERGWYRSAVPLGTVQFEYSSRMTSLQMTGSFPLRVLYKSGECTRGHGCRGHAECVSYGT